jgi:5S rRNA maturation endonuclease (ribonuclease M5)
MDKVVSISEWVEELNLCRKCIIAEGPKDIKSLRAIGVENRIYQLSKTPLYEIIEIIASETKDVVILTDFDKKGKELYGKLNSDLQKFGVRVDNGPREWLLKNTKLSHIEGLSSYNDNLERKK